MCFVVPRVSLSSLLILPITLDREGEIQGREGCRRLLWEGVQVRAQASDAKTLLLSCILRATETLF